MSDLTQRIEGLSPGKRALLMRHLQKRTVEAREERMIGRRDELDDYPLSYAQQRLWFLDQFEPSSTSYNICAAVRLIGPLNSDALQRSLDKIVRRHEVLRATFVTEKGYPVQVIVPDLSVSIRMVDLSERPPNGREAEMHRQIGGEARRPFDLREGPLMRVSLFKMDDEEHVALLTMHHIISDGWSTGVFIRELASHYDAFSNGLPSPLTRLPIQYADYADWQRQWLRGDVMERQLGYWKERLTDSPSVLELPTDRPRPPVQTYRGAHHTFEIPQDLHLALKILSRDNDATLFMTLLAAFQTLLYRYTDQDVINVGTPIANRNREEIEDLIGFFVNTLVMQTDLSGAPTFRNLLRRVREGAIGAYENQDLPFEMLVDGLQLEHEMSHTPLFQVMFDLQALPTEVSGLPDLNMELVEFETGTAKFDLMLMMTEEGSRLRGSFEYNTDLFDASTVQRMAGHLRTVLDAIADDPDRRITDIPLLSEEEQHRLLVSWNDTAVEYIRDECVHERFQRQVQRTPEAVAVVYEREAVSYQELNERANRLAHLLQGLGVGPNVLVGISVERSVDLIVGIMGILKSGGAYLPLDPSYPLERLAFMLRDAGAPVLVTKERFLSTLPTENIETVCLDADWVTIAQRSADDLDSGADPGDVAYTIYTSGSTGRPKGVLIEHHSAVHLGIALTQQIYASGSGDPLRISLNAPPSFDASVQQLVMLTYGHTLHVIPQGVRQDGDALLRYVRRHQLEQLDCVPSQLKLLLEAGLLDGSGWAPLIVMPGGEAIDNSVWQELVKAPNTEFYNMYGPTECAVDSTIGRVKMTVRQPTIGRPVANAQAYVLDRQLRPLPTGVPGELYLGGAGVGRGYLNRPKLTAERFIPDPFGNRPGARLYKTGDLVRHLPDGNTEFLGRTDHQVKVRGYRIELGEIENVLKEHSEVRETVVTVREVELGSQQLVGYVVPEHESAPTVSSMRSFVKERLPEYMVPSVFVTLDALPLTPNSKVDRRALPAPDDSRPELDSVYVPPRTPLERFLAQRWGDLLGLERVGVHDNFFELGGDSLQAAVLINRLQEELDETAHVKALFMAPTVAEMALYMAEYYPSAVTKIDKTALLEEREFSFKKEIAASGRIERVDASTVNRMRQLIPSLPPREEYEVSPQKNPPAIFILSPPRSGSTLFRTMLAGHPRLFAPPELDLLSFNRLDERRAAFIGESSFWLQGPIHAIVELKGCGLDEATEMMEEFEHQKLPVKHLYALLQSWMGDLTLVDKTPTYPLHLSVLQRMEADFERPRYIHLTRHPYATVYSFVEAKLDQVFFRHEHPFSRRVLAELVWIISHENILDFLGGLSDERQHRVAFEDLVRQPEAVMRSVCQFLDIDFHPALVQPYDGDRMTEGVRPGEQMVGDFKFYLRKAIDPRAADRWRRFHTVDFLSDSSWQLAESLGYDRAIPARADVAEHGVPDVHIRPIPREGNLPLSYAQQRLWFLDHLEPGSPFYNIPEAVVINGSLDVQILERSLNEIVRRHEVLRTTFPTVGGKGTQVIAPSLMIPLPVADLSDLPETAREAEVQRQVTEEARRPFNLTTGPLLRVTLLRLDEQSHIALMTMHHIVSDGWSIGLFTKELSELYEAFSDGKRSPLSELRIQFADYAHWQREWLQGEVLEGEIAYWKEQLRGSPPVLELPTDRPRPSVLTFHGARRSSIVTAELTESLKTLGRSEGVTLFMTLLAAFQVLLLRYSGQEDISVGTPISGRGHPEVEDLIGFFVNTLVMRTDLSGAPSFRELLGRVHKVATGAYAHQDVPFEMLVDELQPRRDLSHMPLFQVMFVLQDVLPEPLELPGVTLSPLEADSGTAKFDLTLSVMELEEGLRAIFEYNTDLFDRATIARMMAHFQTLLEGIVTDPDQPIVMLPLLTEIERRQLLSEWIDTETPYPYDKCAHELFEAQVKRSPQAEAVIFGDEVLSYQELNVRANQLAHYLRKLDVGPETLVGLCVERSLEMIVGLLGVLKAGAAYVPLDPDYPAERLSFVLEDADVRVVLTQNHLMERLDASVHTVCLDTDWGQIADESGRRPISGATPDSLAYVIYTSGSTGLPKGTLLQHRGLSNLANAYIDLFELGQGDRVLQFFSLSFDGSVADIFMGLLSGAALCLVPPEARLPGQPLVDFLRLQAVTHAVLTPSVLAMLPRTELAAVRWLAVGGEACLPDLVARWAPRRHFFNVYGPTESTVVGTWHQVVESSVQVTNVPIGRPVPNIRVYILDEALQLVPIGVSGQLHIGGVALARGYLDRPGLTAERFIPDPFSDDPRARLYRTGDLVRYRDDGNIEFLGRMDDQVKVRGFRIELGEIEAVLRRHAALREVALLVREDAPGPKRLVAYVVPEQSPGPTVNELRSFLAGKLPEYMMPSAFVTLRALPLTPSGKVNRRTLPAPGQARPDLESAYLGPRTWKEETLVSIWGQLLEIERVGVHDNFFELGGDSILTIQVVARASQAGLTLTPRQLFEHPTVARLAAVAGTGPAVVAEQGVVEGPLPLTPIQCWFFEQELPQLHHWNQAFLLQVREVLQPGLLAEAVGHLLAHHDALRLRFERGERDWQQFHAALDEQVPFEWVDLSDLPAAERAAAVEAPATQFQRSFDLGEGPLVRVAYFDLGHGQPGRLLMVIHHLAVDGVSWRILMEDLQSAYGQLSQGEPVQLPPKTTSFQTWARRLVEYAQTERVREELPHWLVVGQGGVDHLPMDYPARANTEASARSVRVSLGVEETQALLQDVPGAYGTEMNDALLTALVQAVSGWTGSSRVLVDLEGHGREDILDDVDISRTVGWFTTIYPVSLHLEGVEGPGEALKAVKETLRGVPNRGIGYGLLLYLCEVEGVAAQLRAVPQPAISFNYLGQVDTVLDSTSPFSLAQESPGPSRSSQGRRSHLLSVNGSITGGQLLLEWIYTEDLHRRATIERLAADFLEALRALIAHCQSPDAGGYTPSDFADVELRPEQIEALMTEIGELS